jgi:glycosyltransferase involved in cell wall biosynthesis
LPLEKITVLPRALPLKILYKNDSLVQPAKKINAANIKLVYVGRISKIKGLYLLLSVLDKLKEKNWQLDIYGKVTEESYYQQCLALTEQNKAISWKGVVAPAEVINTLKGYDLLVSPSLVQEMSPLITLEAFAAGIPVLASDVLANREEITEGKNGWLYTLNSKHSLNKKLEYILGNPSILKQASVHLPVLKTFEMVADIHLKIYASDKNKDLTDQKSGKKIKVLHCLNHFLPGHTAGTEVYTWALCKGLQQEGIESEVAIPGYGMDATVTHYYDGIAVHEYAEPSTVDRNLQMGFTLPEGLNYFTELVKKINPDIVHFHELAGSNGFTVSHIEAVAALQFKTMMTFHLASYTCKAKTLLYKDKAFCDGVIDEYKCSECMIATHSSKLIAWPLSVYSKFHFLAGINLSRYPSKLATALGYPFIIKKLREDFYRLDNSCNKLVVLTDWYKKILIANGIAEEKIFLNKQGLVQQQLNEATLMRKPSVALKLVFVGRISHFKGVHLILEALKGMNENKVSLDVYGPEPEDDYAESCKKIMDSMKQVSFKGKLEPDQVVHTMAQYDALVLASTFSEMSPLVIQEAFAAGIPVIASNVYGNAEQVKNGINGWLFKFNDAVDLQKKIETIIANPEILKEAKANIPVPVPRKFENVVDEYIQLYKSMVLVKD